MYYRQWHKNNNKNEIKIMQEIMINFLLSFNFDI